MSLPFDAPAAEPKGMLISLIFAGDILSPFSDLKIWGMWEHIVWGLF